MDIWAGQHTRISRQDIGTLLALKAVSSASMAQPRCIQPTAPYQFESCEYHRYKLSYTVNEFLALGCLLIISILASMNLLPYF